MEKQTKRKNSTKEAYTPKQLQVIRDYNDAVEQNYRVPNALENTSPSADVQNAHELSSSNDNMSNFSENVNVS